MSLCEDRKSFLPLDPASFSLPSAHYRLHRNSVNPAFDLVALYLEPADDTSKKAEEPVAVTRPTYVPGKGWVMPNKGSANKRVQAPRPRARRRSTGAEQNEVEDWLIDAENRAASVKIGELPAGSLDEKVKIGLWRVSGKSVWQVELAASKVRGLCWDISGRYLSLALEIKSKESAGTLQLVHLSAQDGSTVRSISLGPAIPEQTDFDISWQNSKSGWPEAVKGSAAVILSGLHYPDPIIPYESPAKQGGGMNPFGAGGGSAASKSSDKQPGAIESPHVAALPGLIPSSPPDILRVPALDLTLLAGTCPLPGTLVPLAREDGLDLIAESPSEDVLRFARSAETIRCLMSEVWKGLDVVEAAWREGIVKENEAWVEDLETCGKDHGADLPQTLADMTRLLLVGKSSDGVTQFIGAKLTERNLAKWQKAHLAATDLCHSVLANSIFPSLERVILLVEEMIGWAMYFPLFPNFSATFTPDHLNLCLDWLSLLAGRVAALDRLMRATADRFIEFIKWLKSEHSRATIQDLEEESPLPALHDVMAVCEYLDAGLVKDPVLDAFFLTEDEKTTGFEPARLPLKQTQRSLSSVLQDATAFANDANGQPEPTKSPKRRISLTASSAKAQPEEQAPANESLYAIAYTATYALGRLLHDALAGDKRHPTADPSFLHSNNPLVVFRNGVQTILPLELAKSERLLAVDFYDASSVVVLLEADDPASQSKRRYMGMLFLDGSNSRMRYIDHYRLDHVDSPYIASVSTNGRPGRGIAALLTNHGHDLACFDLTIDEGDDDDAVME